MLHRKSRPMSVSGKLGWRRKSKPFSISGQLNLERSEICLERFVPFAVVRLTAAVDEDLLIGSTGELVEELNFTCRVNFNPDNDTDDIREVPKNILEAVDARDEYEYDND